ncbi:hypothetical protein BKA93DRAFT_800863 [Sparassis latifolia]
MAESGLNTFGFVASILSVVALLGPVSGVVYFYLPSRRQTYLDELLCETKDMWRIALEEGLFVSSSFQKFLETTEQNLAFTCSQASNLRTETHLATTLYRQLKGTINGLSMRIVYLCGEVMELRATISSTATEERNKLQQEGCYIPPDLRRIARPAASAITYKSVADTAKSSVKSAAYTNSPDIAKRIPCPGCFPQESMENNSMPSHCDIESTAPNSRSSPMADSDGKEIVLEQHSRADVQAKGAHAQILETDANAIYPALCTGSDQGEDAITQHAFLRDPTLYYILRRIHDDLKARGQSHPLLPAAAEYARAPHCVDIEPLLRLYKVGISMTPSGRLEMQTTRA